MRLRGARAARASCARCCERERATRDRDGRRTCATSARRREEEDGIVREDERIRSPPVRFVAYAQHELRTVAADACPTEESARAARGSLVLEEEGMRHEVGEVRARDGGRWSEEERLAQLRPVRRTRTGGRRSLKRTASMRQGTVEVGRRVDLTKGDWPQGRGQEG